MFLGNKNEGERLAFIRSCSSNNLFRVRDGSTHLLLMVTRYKFRKVERQWDVQDAGVDGMHT